MGVALGISLRQPKSIMFGGNYFGQGYFGQAYQGDVLTIVFLTDVATTSEAINILVSRTLADNGAGSDSNAILASIALTDTGSLASEVVSTLAQVALSDIGAAAEAAAILARLVVSDSGVGLEIVSILSSFVLSDTGLGSDVISILAQIAVSDNSTLANEALSILASIFVTDKGSNYFVNESMAASPTTGTLKNSAIWDVGGYLRLTPALDFKSGQIEYNNTLPDKFEIGLDLWAGGGNGADSVYFYFGNNATPKSEDAATGGYIIAFSEYHDQVELYFNGVEIANYNITTLDNSTWRTAKIFKNGNNFRVLLNDVLIINFTDSTRTLAGTLYGFGARTGGFNNEHRVKNTYVLAEYVEITTQVPIADTTSGSDALSILASIAVTDSGTLASETLAVLASIAVTDSGSASETALQILYGIAVSDSALSSEAIDVLKMRGLYTRAGQLFDLKANLYNY